MKKLAILFTLCASTSFATLASGIDTITVSPGGWYHVSAQFWATNSAQKLSVTLHYADANGKPCGEERVLSSGGKSAEKPFRLHKIVRMPPKAVKCEIVKKGGDELVRNVKFNSSMADCRDETDETQLLNCSFEEADLTPDFIDCWRIVRGSAKRTAGDAHRVSPADFSIRSFSATSSTTPAASRSRLCTGWTANAARPRNSLTGASSHAAS